MEKADHTEEKEGWLWAAREWIGVQHDDEVFFN
jgi:hypothetical protein